MSWVRAVWDEVSEDGESIQYEQTIPSNWVIDKVLYWPNHLNVKRSFHNREDPKPDWKCFKLKKIKVTGIFYYKAAYEKLELSLI